MSQAKVLQTTLNQHISDALINSSLQTSANHTTTDLMWPNKKHIEPQFVLLYLNAKTYLRAYASAYADSEDQVSLRNRAVWSGPSLSPNSRIGYYRMYEWKAKAHAQGDLYQRVLHIFEDTFLCLLDVAHKSPQRTMALKARINSASGYVYDAIYFKLYRIVNSSRKHAFIILTPLNPTFI